MSHCIVPGWLRFGSFANLTLRRQDTALKTLLSSNGMLAFIRVSNKVISMLIARHFVPLVLGPVDRLIILSFMQSSGRC